jgi:hypothetical protein
MNKQTRRNFQDKELIKRTPRFLKEKGDIPPTLSRSKFESCKDRTNARPPQ